MILPNANSKKFQKKYSVLLLGFILNILFFFAVEVVAIEDESNVTVKIENLLNLHITHSGPNCWNTALVATGLNSKPRYTSAEEFNFLMESSLCRKIKPQNRKFADIQIIRRTISFLDPIEREVHASVWLEEKNLFSKKTLRFTEQYKIVPEAEVMDAYLQISPIMRFSKVIDGVYTPVACEGEECLNKIEYRRCQNREQLINHLPLVYQEKWSALLELEDLFGDLVISDLPDSTEQINLIRKKMSFLGQTLKARRRDSFLTDYIAVALISFEEQLQIQQPKALLSM